jgi:hypothetical protein
VGSGDVDDDLPGAEAGPLGERVGEERNRGQIGVPGQPDHDLVGTRDEGDVEWRHVAPFGRS